MRSAWVIAKRYGDEERAKREKRLRVSREKRLKKEDSSTNKTDISPITNLSETIDTSLVSITDKGSNMLNTPGKDVSECVLVTPEYKDTLPVLNNICQGCGYTCEFCPEVKYRNICLHGIIDYHDDVGLYNISDEGIYKAYHDTYLNAIRCDMYTISNYYEIRKELEIPECMKRGSYRKAVQMLRGHRDFMYFRKQRIADVATKVKEGMLETGIDDAN
mgnify:CR=1 FL=1